MQGFKGLLSNFEKNREIFEGFQATLKEFVRFLRDFKWVSKAFFENLINLEESRGIKRDFKGILSHSEVVATESRKFQAFRKQFCSFEEIQTISSVLEAIYKIPISFQ